MEVMIAHVRDSVTPPSQTPSWSPRRPRTRRAPLPCQESARSLPGYAEPRRRPGPLRRRRQLVADDTPHSGGKPTRTRPRAEPARARQPSAARDHGRSAAATMQPRQIAINLTASRRSNSMQVRRNADHATTAASWMTRTDVAATVHLAFAFDIGDEVDLDRARLILQGEPGQLPRRRRTPESIRYRPAPIRVELDPSGIALPGELSLRPPAARRADALRFRRDLARVSGFT